jgi:hypothetical protein
MLDAMGQAFGCHRCYGADPEEVWAYYERGLRIAHELVDEAHFIIQLRRCAECAQQFVWILTERVDWDGGEDAQRRNVVPVSPEEAQTLAESSDLDPAFVASLVGDRRHLETDWPTGELEQRSEWATGKLEITSEER